MRKSLFWRLFLALSLVALITVVTVSVAGYLSQRSALQYQLEQQLNTVADLKKTELTLWLNERQADVHMLAVNRLNEEHFTELFDPSIPAQRKEEFAEFLADNLRGLLASRIGYTRAVMTDRSGNVIIATDEDWIGHTLADDLGFRGTLSSADGAFIQDIHPDPETGTPRMQFGHVLHAIDLETGKEIPDEITGVVLTTVDMADTVYTLISSWPGRGKTGDIRLVGRQDDEIILLSSPMIESRVKLFQTLIFQEPEIMPAYKAAMGQEGLILTTDLDNQQVLAVYRYIPQTGWGFIVLKAMDEVMVPVQALALRLEIIALFIFVMAALISLAVSRTLIQPIRRLVSATQAVAAGNLSVDLEISQTDELGALADAFHTMVDAVDRRQQEIRSLNQGLEQQVEERTWELAQANAQLKELDALKSQFVSNVSHELRTPVTNLKLYLGMLERQTEEKRAEYIEVLKGQAEILAQLIEDILSLSQLESRAGRLDLGQVDLNTLNQEIVQAHEPRAEAKGLQLTLQKADKLPVIQGDLNQLRQVFTNLMANAINYTTDGSVQVRTSVDGEYAVVEVIDTGMGIDEEDMPRLFERFYRGSRVSQSTLPGTGLGLGIVKEIVTLHQGTIQVDSTVAEGTTMRIRLPIAGPEPPASS